MVGPVLRSSILDHIYVTDNNYLSNVTHVKPCFGDHVLIMADCCTDRPENKALKKRDWRLYSKEKLCENLSRVDWSNGATTVQEA